MNQFQEMATYIAVVEAANISAAARRLGTTKSVVSRRIQQLETRLGTVLFERGKTLGLTDAGHLFYQRAVLILSEVSDAEESVRTLHGQLQGPLRLTAPMAFSIRYLAPLLSTFMAQYPSLNLDVEYSDRLANLNQENFDVAIRIGPLADSDLIAQRICANRHLICASPATRNTCNSTRGCCIFSANRPACCSSPSRVKSGRFVSVNGCAPITLFTCWRRLKPVWASPSCPHLSPPTRYARGNCALCWPPIHPTAATFPPSIAVQNAHPPRSRRWWTF
jgi:transposase-like protein